MGKIRADVRLVELGLVSSREKAKVLIMAGSVLEGTRRIEKPGEKVREDAVLTLKESLRYVSRGGYKLEKILETQDISLNGAICVDIGASTGGFTDCMLQHGAKKVYAIDVGYGQLDYRLRQDERVVSMERTNIRTFDPAEIHELVDFVSIDVSFISLALVLPVAKEIVRQGGLISALIKPQFEAGREQVGKKGIIRDPKVHLQVLKKMEKLVESLDLNPKIFTYSPIKGTTGNIEFLMLLEKGPRGNQEFDLSKVVEETVALSKEE